MKKGKTNRNMVRAALLLSLLLPFGATSAQEGQEQDVKPVEIIFEHIKDSYGWHITTVNGKDVSIPLPVIVHSSNSGWNVFSSARLEGGKTYKGFYIAASGDNEGKIVERGAAGEEVKPLDISLTKNALALVVNSMIMLAVFLSAAAWYKRNPKHAVPKGFVCAVEMFVMSIEDDVIRKSIGKDYKRYSPYLLTAFFFIFINNVMGLIPIFPGGANTTGNIAVTLTLALCTMFAINAFGNKEYWKEIFWPDVPMWLKVPIPLMPAIELFGVLSKPFALMVRLFANIMAGHAIAVALTCIVFVSVKMGVAMNSGMTAFYVLLSVFMSCLEILVAYIQAYVFTMLSAVFIGLSRQEAHKAKREKAKA